MLNADDTAGALVAGRRIAISGKSFDEVQALRDRAEKLGAKLFVAGDTSSDSGEESFMESAVIGFPIAIAEADGEPVEIGPSGIDDALAKAQAVDWSSLDVAELDELDTYLMSWGPLPAARLSLGMRVDAAMDDDGRYREPGAVRYKFFSMQNMSQERGAEGVDGISLQTVEFGEVIETDVSPQTLAARAAEVPLLESPRVFLTARYD